VGSEASGYVVRSDDVQPFGFYGLWISDYTSGKNSNSSIALIDVPADASHPLAYSRRSDKYYFVVTGRVSFTVDNSTDELGPSDLLVLPAGTRFAYRAIGDAAQLLLVHTPAFDPDAEVILDA